MKIREIKTFCSRNKVMLLILLILLIAAVVYTAVATQRKKKTIKDMDDWFEGVLRDAYGLDAKDYTVHAYVKDTSRTSYNVTVDGRKYTFEVSYDKKTGNSDYLADYFRGRIGEQTGRVLEDAGLLKSGELKDSGASYLCYIDSYNKYSRLPISISKDDLEKYLQAGTIPDCTLKKVTCTLKVTLTEARRLTKEQFSGLKENFFYLSELIIRVENSGNTPYEYHYFPKEDRLRIIE